MGHYCFRKSNQEKQGEYSNRDPPLPKVILIEKGVWGRASLLIYLLKFVISCRFLASGILSQLLFELFNQSQRRGASPPDVLIKSRPRRTARPILLPIYKQSAMTPPTELKAPCAHCQICYRFRRMRPCTCES